MYLHQTCVCKPTDPGTIQFNGDELNETLEVIKM